MRIQQVLLPIFVYKIPNAFPSVVLEFSFQKSVSAPRCCAVVIGTVPLWWRAPAPADPPSFARPASCGGSCSDSGGQTLSPAGLEEHKGQRRKTSHDPWKRIIAMGDVVACYTGWVWKLHYQPGDKSLIIRSIISFKNSPGWCVVAGESFSACWRTFLD